MAAEKKLAEVIFGGNAKEAEPITVDPALSCTEKLTAEEEGL